MATTLSNAARVDLERRIVLGLIRSLKKSGFVPFRTWDGESFVYLAGEVDAMKAVFAVDEISLRFVPAGVRRAGARRCEDAEHGVLLVLGNGEDVISDWNYFDRDTDGFNAAMAAFCYDSDDGKITMLSRLPSGADLAAVIS